MTPHNIDPAYPPCPLLCPDLSPDHPLDIQGGAAAPGSQDTVGSHHLAHLGMIHVGRNDGEFAPSVSKQLESLATQVDFHPFVRSGFLLLLTSLNPPEQLGLG